jgi:hypothetical protein
MEQKVLVLTEVEASGQRKLAGYRTAQHSSIFPHVDA